MIWKTLIQNQCLVLSNHRTMIALSHQHPYISVHVPPLSQQLLSTLAHQQHLMLQ